MKRRSLPPQASDDRVLDGLVDALLSLRGAGEVRAFLRDLCTPAELQAMADRWQVVPLVLQGVPYREIHDRTGHTTVFVTHDQEEALELADRVVVMSQGRIEQIGTADEVYDNPDSPFVYGFIGESSALPVRVEHGDIWLEDRTVGLRAPHLPDGPATLYFRPHDVDILDGCGGCIAGTVVAGRRVAGTRRVELEIGGGGHVAEIELPVEHPAADRTRIAFRPRRWKAFPAAATGG